MKNKRVRKSISFILAMAFLFSFGISAFAAEDKTDTVNVNATSADQTVEVGNIDTENTGLYVSSSYGYSATVTTGNITSTGSDGINTSIYGGADVTVNGSVTSTSEGIHAHVYSNGDATINVTGDVNADYAGIDLCSLYGDASLDINIGGSITAGQYGIYTDDYYDNAEFNLNVGGNIESAEEAITFYAYNKNVATINVKGDVNVTSDTGFACFDIGSDDESIVEINVGGNASSKGDGSYLYTDESGQLTLSVKGDFIAENNVIWADIYSSDSVVDVLVEGTVTGNHPVALDGDGGYSADGLVLTAWRIVPNADGNIAEDYDYGNGTYAKNADFEKKIKYIIKLEQPEGATLSATDANGKALAKSHDWDVANEGDRVLLKVDLQKGYKLLGAYNGDGEKLALLKDAAGNYYVDVTKGGGVYLSVELDRETYNITLDLGDATYNGHTGLYTFSGKYGDKIILGTPYKEGFRFLYWEGSRYYAGDEYTITEDHTLKAVFEKIEDESIANTDNGMLTHFTAFMDMDTHSGGGSTGAGTNSAGFWLVVVCVSLLSAFVGVVYSSKHSKRVRFDV